MTPRQWWKIYYRQLRIIRRETFKGVDDLILFGSCFIETGENVPDFIRHIPLGEIYEAPSKE